MKFQTIKLQAGIGTPVGVAGSYFRVLSGTADFRVTFKYASGQQYDTLFKVGIGVQLPERFTGITIQSTIDQTVEIAYSSGRIDDSRLVGSVNAVNSPATGYDEEITAVTAQTATKVASENGNRVVGTLVVTADGYLWHDNTVDSSPGSTKGIPYTAGSLLEIRNTAELWFMSEIAADATLLEEVIA